MCRRLLVDGHHHWRAGPEGGPRHPQHGVSPQDQQRRRRRHSPRRCSHQAPATPRPHRAGLEEQQGGHDAGTDGRPDGEPGDAVDSRPTTRAVRWTTSPKPSSLGAGKTVLGLEESAEQVGCPHEPPRHCGPGQQARDAVVLGRKSGSSTTPGGWRPPRDGHGHLGEKGQCGPHLPGGLGGAAAQ